MKIYTTLIILLLQAGCSYAQKYEIPVIDWEALQETRPWEATEDWNSTPSKVSPAMTNTLAPSDAIILFDGHDLSAWQKPKYGIGADMATTEAITKNAVYENHPGTEAEWNIVSDALVVKPGGGNIQTKKSFGSIQLHLEWLSPVDKDKEGQAYSNSGVFLMGLYELQILNSYNNKTYPNGQAGAIYKQNPPLVNTSRPPGEWQSYDIIFIAPKFSDDGQLLSPAYLTAFHNGILIQNNFELEGPTLYIGQADYFPHPDKLPLLLQDHGDLVRFRNIWLRELE